MAESMRRYDAEQLRAQLEEWTNKTSLRKTAKALGFSPAYISDVMKCRRNVSENLAEALGFNMHTETVTYYTKMKGKANG
jgi:plasmid maintenance system antidote protein VapI